MKALIMKYATITVLLITAVACSFSIPRRELRSTAQVAGIALDEVDGKLRATFELYVPVLEEPIGSNRQTVVTTGNTLQECIDRAQRTGGEGLFSEDASALILGRGDEAFLITTVFEHYRLLKNDQMDLPVFFALDQSAGDIFAGEGAVLSGELAESAGAVERVQTVRDLMNGTGKRVWIRGEGCYEIVS